MGCLGVHFGLMWEEVERLCAFDDEGERVEYLHEVIEEEYFRNQPQWKAESDKAWDAMHRALTKGELTRDERDYPFSHVVLGGESLYSESDFIMVLENPDQV